jgi:hypothetical protein
MYAMIGSWNDWIATAWPKLASGAKLEAPRHLPHPKHAGFNSESIATPEGQCANWVLSYNDGSRIHVHEHGDGRRVVHRDQYDPNQGLGNMIAHLVFETALVPVVLLGIGLVAGTRSARA